MGFHCMQHCTYKLSLYATHTSLHQLSCHVQRSISGSHYRNIGFFCSKLVHLNVKLVKKMKQGIVLDRRRVDDLKDEKHKGLHFYLNCVLSLWHRVC